MTSLERRREGRYQRRRASREQKKIDKYSRCDDYQNIIRYRSLYGAYRKSIRNVIWKTSVQRYQMNLLRYIEDTHSRLRQQEDITRGFVEFDIIERGKPRHIRSVHFTERVVQRAVCDQSLTPLLTRGLIYDTGACLEGKGVDFAMDRLEAQLQNFYRSNNFSNDGWVLLFDFSGYFDGILHSECFNIYSRAYRDQRIIWLLSTFLIPFGFPTENTQHHRILHSKRTGPNSGKSLGLGSQISQITAVAYPSDIDHYIKQTMRVRWYERYMDDGLMIFKLREQAVDALHKLVKLCEKKGIKINLKKTKIVKLKFGFKFLKATHRLTDTGKVIRKVAHESITRERRRLKKFANMVKEGIMTIQDVANAYCSWKGYALHRGGKRAVERMDQLFRDLFHRTAPECKIKNRRKKQWQTRRILPPPLPKVA